jgi:hypothetical protein
VAAFVATASATMMYALSRISTGSFGITFFSFFAWPFSVSLLVVRIVSTLYVHSSSLYRFPDSRAMHARRR